MIQWIEIKRGSLPPLYKNVLLCRKRSFWVGKRGSGTYKHYGKHPTHFAIVDLPPYQVQPKP